MAELEIRVQSPNGIQSNLYLVLPSDVHCRISLLSQYMAVYWIISIRNDSVVSWAGLAYSHAHISELQGKGKDKKHNFYFPEVIYITCE